METGLYPKAYLGNNPYIFVSYAHADNKRVYPFIIALQKEYNVWFDEGITYGSEWSDEIAERIDNCSLFIYVVTKASLNSKHCLNEIYYASDHGKVFISIFENSDIKYEKGMELRYNRYQKMYLDKYNSLEDAIHSLSEKSPSIIETCKAELKQGVEEAPAESFDAETCFSMGEDYYYGRKGKNKDYKEAAKWFLRAAESGYLGHALAQYYLGVINENGEGVEPSDAIAFTWYRRSAGQGVAKAQFRLGVFLQEGKGVTADRFEAVHWFRRAAIQGDAAAQCKLGLAYLKGKGINSDYSEAVSWFRKSADNGNALAQYYLGELYLRGIGVIKDTEKAEKWFLKAAEKGNIEAQIRLGHMYMSGDGVTRNYAEGVKWFRKAAEQGSAIGQYNLGFAYRIGKGVPFNNTEAVRWFIKSAGQGYASAQYSLAKMYEEGTGIDRDYSTAVEYYRKAAKQGDDRAKHRLEELNESLF